MDKVIMSEFITPEIAELISKNPEALKIVVDQQPGEEVIVEQDSTSDYNSDPTNVESFFCDANIDIDDTENECNKGVSTGETENRMGNCHIKINSGEHNQEDSLWERPASELSQLKLEVAVLEARIEEIDKVLRQIPRQICNRKLVARCKKDMREAGEHLVAKKKELGNWDWITEFWES